MSSIVEDSDDIVDDFVNVHIDEKNEPTTIAPKKKEEAKPVEAPKPTATPKETVGHTKKAKPAEPFNTARSLNEYMESRSVFKGGNGPVELPTRKSYKINTFAALQEKKKLFQRCLEQYENQMEAYIDKCMRKF